MELIFQRKRTGAPLTASLKCFPDLNRTTLRALIGASWPVLGFRPTRAFFARTWKEPNLLRMTGLPISKVALMVSMMVSTASSALTLLSPVSSATRLMISIFVKVSPLSCFGEHAPVPGYECDLCDNKDPTSQKVLQVNILEGKGQPGIRTKNNRSPEWSQPFS